MSETLKTVDADTLLSTPLQKTFFVVDELIPQGVTMLCGDSKIGKSWMMLWLGLQVSQGLPVWDLPTAQCDVLYLCLEDTFRRGQNRLYQLTNVGPDNLRFAVMSKQISLGLEEQLEEYLVRYPKTGLLIIDTLQKVRDSKGMNGRNGMYGGDYDDMSAVKIIADRHNIAIVLVHHLRKMKDAKDPFNEVSGSTGLLGAADTMLLLKKDSRMADTATLTATGRDIQGLQLILRFERFVWQVVERKDSAALHRDEVPAFLFALVEFMRTHGEWTGTATELLAEMEDSETAATAVTKLLSHFYYEALVPVGIEYRTKRTGKSRLITLTCNDGYDANDGKLPIEKTPSQPS